MSALRFIGKLGCFISLLARKGQSLIHSWLAGRKASRTTLNRCRFRTSDTTTSSTGSPSRMRLCCRVHGVSIMTCGNRPPWASTRDGANHRP